VKLKHLAAVVICAFGCSAGPIFLQWSYPSSATNIVFEVWRSDPGLTNWQLDQVVAATNAPIDPTNRAAFYRVRARDVCTGLLSDWATTDAGTN
jgi:hypothetical protein